MAKFDLTGQRFKRLTVIEENGRNNRNEILWRCKCDCGKETNVTTYRLRKNITRSCGCLMVDTCREQMRELGKSLKTHGLSKTRIYKTYRGIKDRCLNPNDMHYPDYGGRGIKMCDEWKNDFMNFYNWAMENGYTDELTIDRIDVNGNYEPSNCRWVDIKTQSNNKRTNRYIEFNGEVKTLSQWAEIYGVDRGTIAARIDRYGMSLEDALTMSPFECRSRARGKKVSVKNIQTGTCKIYNSLKDAAKDLGVKYKNLSYYKRYNKIYEERYLIEEL